MARWATGLPRVRSLSWQPGCGKLAHRDGDESVGWSGPSAYVIQNTLHSHPVVNQSHVLRFVIPPPTVILRYCDCFFPSLRFDWVPNSEYNFKIFVV